MIARLCDNCRKEIPKAVSYIQVTLEAHGSSGGVISGLPLHVQGDFCSVMCLRDRL